jgi:hypothetical protein
MHAAKPAARHFLREPAPADRFSVAEGDPRDCPRALDTVRRLMGGLARRMHMAPTDTEGSDRDNPALPAGYTYLLQFVAHDMIDSTATFRALGREATELRNRRATRLRLDTLYGNGPESCPFAYAPSADATPRTRLRLGAFASPTAGYLASLAPPRRDVPRAAGAPGGMGDVLLADGRNDSNTNLSQMTVLFSALHNAILERLPSPRHWDPGSAARLTPAARFACAREATTLLYRAMIRADLLPRLLHPAIWAAYRDADAEALLDAGTDPGLPVEFSTGAFRFGHAMVRSDYRINDGSRQELFGVLMRTSRGMAAPLPNGPDWAVSWRHFFELRRDTAPNPSHTLRPRYAGDLQLAQRFGAIDGTGTIGLAYRDLMSAALADLWSVPALYREVAARRGALLHGCALADTAERERRLADWLSRYPSVTGFTDSDIQAIAHNPPLPFYILFEAEQESAGGALGRLGSVLVAEAILGTLLRDPLPSEAAAGGNVATALAWLGNTLLGEPCLASVAHARHMRDLVAIAATATGMGTDIPPFC